VSERIFALLVHSQHEPMASLKRALEYLSVAVYPVSNCRDAESLLWLVQPDIVFTDASLPDGGWADIINRSKDAKAPVNVIVVGGRADTELHSFVIRQGGFDFIVPPFDLAPLALRVRMAAQRAGKPQAAKAGFAPKEFSERAAVAVGA
jgi:DNA-binding response OmpR family regulator